MGVEKSAGRILVARPDGKRSLGRTKRRREDNIKMYLQEMGWESMDWFDLPLARDRALVLAVMNLRIPYNVGNFLTS
jgi:hypothetical protein